MIIGIKEKGTQEITEDSILVVAITNLNITLREEALNHLHLKVFILNLKVILAKNLFLSIIEVAIAEKIKEEVPWVVILEEMIIEEVISKEEMIIMEETKEVVILEETEAVTLIEEEEMTEVDSEVEEEDSVEVEAAVLATLKMKYQNKAITIKRRFKKLLC